MIYRIVARNPKNELLDMDIRYPEKSGFNITNITGITPMGAEIYSTPFGALDGGLFVGARVPSRNVVITMEMYEEQTETGEVKTIEDARLKMYNFFRIKDWVNLVFYTTNRVLQLLGYVESAETDIFSEKETATVSIVCVDPWFYSSDYSQISFAGTMPAFTFPFSSVSGSEIPSELLVFGNISVDTRTDIMYYGDIQTGFNMSITFMGNEFHNIYFYNMGTRERMDIYTDQIEVLTGTPLGPGDELQISTISGQKSAYLLRNGDYKNVISIIDKNADWFQLTKGNNVFAFSSDAGVEDISISLNWRDAYAGI